MAKIKEFCGLRPRKDLVEKVAELPYDVVSTEEAAAIAENNPYSFYHVSKPEIDLSENISLYDDIVYATGRKNLDKFVADGVLVPDTEPSLYLYTLIREGRSQTGLVTVVSIDDYLTNHVKKHELTREDKEKDRMRHIDVLNSQTGPVFLMYKESGKGKELFNKALALTPEYDYTAKDGVRHIFRKISDKELIGEFKEYLNDKDFYIADGHHRAAAGVLVGQERRKNGAEPVLAESNYFLGVVFPNDQLAIMAYNRVVKDLHGNSKEDFLSKIGMEFNVVKNGVKIPENKQNFSMYLDKEWYALTPKKPVLDKGLNGLDVNILQTRILAPILNIENPRVDKRINFIGGIRGTAELEKLVDGGEYQVAFSMFPTTIEELLEVSDNGEIMPPKSTWFEPKLRDALVIHMLD